MTNEAACNSKSTAISILEVIMENIKSDSQRAALKAVTDWVEKNVIGKIPDTPEERKTLCLKIKSDMRDCMTKEQRQEEAAFYLEGITA
jgi:hypothetical protein